MYLALAAEPCNPRVTQVKAIKGSRGTAAAGVPKTVSYKDGPCMALNSFSNSGAG